MVTNLPRRTWHTGSPQPISSVACGGPLFSLSPAPPTLPASDNSVFRTCGYRPNLRYPGFLHRVPPDFTSSTPDFYIEYPGFLHRVSRIFTSSIPDFYIEYPGFLHRVPRIFTSSIPDFYIHLWYRPSYNRVLTPWFS